MELKNKIIVITGASGGIGSALVAKLAENNTIIAIDCDKTRLAEQVKQYAGSLVPVCCDIASGKAVDKALGAVGSKYGRIDLLINNAGRQRIGRFDQTKFEDIIETNLLGTMRVTQNVLKYMPDGGRIFNVLSVHSTCPRKDKISYDVSKAGLKMFTKELALELAERKITVNSLSIGACATPMNGDWLNDSKAVKAVTGKIPLGVIDSSDNVTEYIITLLRFICDNTTGSDFVIDQGRSLRG